MDKLLPLLEEIRDNQQKQLSVAEEAIRLQKEHFTLLKQNLDRAEKIQARAEVIQKNASKILNFMIFPIIVILIIFLAWKTFLAF